MTYSPQSSIRKLLALPEKNSRIPTAEPHEPAVTGVAAATGPLGAFFFATVLLVEAPFLAGEAFFAAFLTLAQRAF
jgi:hypothetical protein